MKEIKDFFKWHKTVRKELRVLLYITFISVILLDFWLFDVKEWFPYASNLGGLYYKICLAYITSFIFYYINIHIQSERLKSKTMIYINNKIVPIYTSARDLLYSFSPEIDKDNVLEENIETVLSAIDPHSEGSFMFRGNELVFEDWFTALDRYYYLNKELIHDTMLFKESINSDVLGILSRIEDNLVNHVNVFKGIKTANDSLEIISSGIYNHVRLTKRLVEVFQEKHKIHLKEQENIFKSEYYINGKNE